MKDTERKNDLNYTEDTYECSACLWADQCAAAHTCDNFTPTGQDIDQIIENTRLSYREEFLQYADMDADIWDWGYSYRKA